MLTIPFKWLHSFSDTCLHNFINSPFSRHSVNYMIAITLQWRHNEHMKSPAYQVFTHPFVQVLIKENIKAPRYWPFVQGIHRSPGNSLTKASDASLTPLAFVRGIHRWPGNSSHKGPVTQKMFPFDDIIMILSVPSATDDFEYCLTDRMNDHVIVIQLTVAYWYYRSWSSLV